MVKVGDPVIYVDPKAKEHHAVVTADWGQNTAAKSVNVVYVTDDENSTDSYGRQIARATSVVHESFQAAHGNFWKLAA